MSEMNKTSILIVEDELDVLQVNARIMRRRGYTVLTAATYAEAQQILSETQPELLILDIMLPDGDGLELCERFRESSDNPVIFLTGKTETVDKIDGLAKGADYYLTKPYDVDELLAVVSRLLERRAQAVQRQTELLLVKRGPLTLDVSRARATINGENVNLTAKEFALLLVLAQNQEREFSPGELYETVWGVPSADDVRTIRTHIKNLRRKIDADNAIDYDIVSSYGRGYMFTTIC